MGERSLSPAGPGPTAHYVPRGWVGVRTGRALFDGRFGGVLENALAELVGVCPRCWTPACGGHPSRCLLVAYYMGCEARALSLRALLAASGGVFHPYRPGESWLTPPGVVAHPTVGSAPGCDRCGALDGLGWAVTGQGCLTRLCPTHQADEREREKACARAETDVRARYRMSATVTPPTFAGLPLVTSDQVPPDTGMILPQPVPAADRDLNAEYIDGRPVSGTAAIKFGDSR
ncbi:hypothetical protein KGD82_16565 [Nocardiopsis eucommiae]|uniref:Uncharacterized protein n=1 Tax=Nocardiopsis eucommiae TaxID=2831970 RepID=A0A975L869_9ACTN|nr:hypothetical protein KGD82_16565 [Nocardiopsis eucommiae]